MHISLSFACLLPVLFTAAALSGTEYSERSIRIPLSPLKWQFKRDLQSGDVLNSPLTHSTINTAGLPTEQSNIQVSEHTHFRRALFGPLALVPSSGLFYGTLTIGNQDLQFAFDTGSPYLWVVASDCIIPECEGHIKYIPSTTASGGTESCQVKYVGGLIDGMWYTDVVTVAGVRVEGVSLCAATTITRNFRKPNFPPSGVVGLGIPESLRAGDGRMQNPLNRRMSLVDTLIARGLLHSNQFAFKLTQQPELVLGYSNIFAFQGEVTWLSVLYPEQGTWIVNFDAITVNDQLAIDHPSKAFVDTGTTMTFGPKAQVAALYSKVEHAFSSPESANSAIVDWVVPCETKAVVSLVFAGKSFSFSRESLACTRLTNGWCQGSIKGATFADEDGIWLLGNTFQANFYSIYEIQGTNGGPARIGLADLAPGDSAAKFRQFFDFLPA